MYKSPPFAYPKCHLVRINPLFVRKKHLCILLKTANFAKLKILHYS